MAPKLEHDKYVNTPPGDGLLEVFEKSSIAKVGAEHSGVLQTIYDHQIIWENAETVEGKIEAHLRFRRQMARGLINFGGFEIAVHGIVDVAVGTWLTGGSLFLVGAFVMYVTRRGG